MQSRGRQPNLSFFAFTATPKGKTLELFGRPGPSGLPEAFHLYSMRQAIEEGFILDVVKKYTTYTTYYRLVKAVEDDPNLPKKKAVRALAKFMSLHPHNLEQKTEVIIEHFRHKVRGHLGGQAKAMVVTSSRLHAVRYMQAFQRYIAGEIALKEGDPEGVKSPTDVGTGKAKDEQVPLSEIITVLNERFGTNFADEDRFFFEQIREKATSNEQVVKLRRANPFDKFQLGLRQLLEDLMPP